MKAFVTGATGFVGSYVTKRLLEQGVEVAILRRESSDLTRLKNVIQQTTQIIGDLNHLSDIRHQIRAYSPDVIFHIGWQDVAGKHRNANTHIDQNLTNTIALGQLALKIGCDTFIGLGSQAEYGNLNHTLSEEVLPKPTTMYGVTKLCAYLLLNQLLSESKIRFIWIRLFSSYGPFDNPNWLLPYLIRKLLLKEKPSLTAGEQLWDYVYIEDVAEAIISLAQSNNAKGIFNLGSGEVNSIRSIAELVRDIIDPNLQLGLGEVAYRPDQIMHLQADITRLTQITGWTPSTSLEAGLTQTIESMKHDSGTLK